MKSARHVLGGLSLLRFEFVRFDVQQLPDESTQAQMARFRQLFKPGFLVGRHAHVRQTLFPSQIEQPL